MSISAQRWNALVDKAAEFRRYPTAYRSYAEIEVTATVDLAAFSIFGVVKDLMSSLTLPRLKSADPVTSPSFLAVNEIEVKSGNVFLARMVNNLEPIMVRQTGVVKGRTCKPNASYQVTNPGTLTCIDVINNLAVVVQNNYVHQMIGQVQSAATKNGGSGTIKLKYRNGLALTDFPNFTTALTFTNFTNNDMAVNDYIKVRNTIGHGLVAAQ